MSWKDILSPCLPPQCLMHKRWPCTACALSTRRLRRVLPVPRPWEPGESSRARQRATPARVAVSREGAVALPDPGTAQVQLEQVLPDPDRFFLERPDDLLLYADAARSSILDSGVDHVYIDPRLRNNQI